MAQGELPVGAWRIIVLATILLVWQLASIAAAGLFLPSPIDVAVAFVQLVADGRIVSATASSLLVFGGGFVLAALAAIPLGVLMGGAPRVGEVLEVYVNGLNAAPRVAFIPLIIVWFGFGIEAKIVIVWLSAVLPMVINTYAGVLNTDPDLLEAARSFGARPSQLLRTVVLPSALPSIITGLRVGASLGIIGTVVGELYTALSGLGYLLALFGNTFQIARYFVPVLVLIAMGVLISEGLKRLESRLSPWRTSRSSSSVFGI
jgi:ABC-type nitrate/sulfonate/bicarbonate transport system permease component